MAPLMKLNGHSTLISLVHLPLFIIQNPFLFVHKLQINFKTIYFPFLNKYQNHVIKNKYLKRIALHLGI